MNYELLQSSYIHADASIEHGTLHWAPHHRGVEGATPWVDSIDDGLLLTEARQVLTSDIDGEMTEPSRNLCRHLFVGTEAAVP